MSDKHVRRPTLERFAPRRDWSTLFGVSPPPRDGGAARGRREPGDGALSDTVEMGYRVIGDYLKQGRQVAQAFAPPGFMGGAAGGAEGGAASVDEMQQMAQRVMQYGWDFAGLWFEMWTRMGGASGWPTMPNFFNGPGPMNTAPPPERPSNAAPTPPMPRPSHVENPSDVDDVLIVVVDSAQPTTTSVKLRPGRGQLSIQKLRPENHDGPPITDVALEKSAEGLRVMVRVAPDQEPGSYRAAIVDDSNQLRGSLSVTVLPSRR